MESVTKVGSTKSTSRPVTPTRFRLCSFSILLWGKCMRRHHVTLDNIPKKVVNPRPSHEQCWPRTRWDSSYHPTSPKCMVKIELPAMLDGEQSLESY